MKQEFNNDTFTVLNYQGSKKNLLKFIYDNIVNYVDENKAFLDIFSGTCSVGYSFKRNFTVYANDSEKYAYIIASALLNNKVDLSWEEHQDKFEYFFHINYSFLENKYLYFLKKENEYLKNNDLISIIKLYDSFPCIWSSIEFDYYQGKIKSIKDMQIYSDQIPFMLFTSYYSNTYFGIQQSIEIDSIRYAISKFDNEVLKNIMLTSLFYAMKECVFSKDGHMAQPLDINKNGNKLIKIRKKSIYDIFAKKIQEFFSHNFVSSNKENKVFNKKFPNILELDEIKDNVSFIYADPPYTDMQYSRYYHLLNTVTNYSYECLSKNNGLLSKGLYTENRFQSPLSQRSKAENEILKLLNYCKKNNKNLGLSYAYPRDPITQPTNRYTMNINTIILNSKEVFGDKNVNVLTEEYEHSNNRNNSSKKVLEYLIVCKN